jgi:hypothetical protein
MQKKEGGIHLTLPSFLLWFPQMSFFSRGVLLFFNIGSFPGKDARASEKPQNTLP